MKRQRGEEEKSKKGNEKECNVLPSTFPTPSLAPLGVIYCSGPKEPKNVGG